VKLALFLIAGTAFADAWIAHRVDDQRIVFFFAEADGPADPPTETIHPQAQYAGDFSPLSEAKLRSMKLTQMMVGDNKPARLNLKLREQLSLRIAGGDTARVEIEQYVHEVTCSDHFIGAIARVIDNAPAFASTKQKYYVVGDLAPAKPWASSAIRKADLDNSKLEPLLNAQLKIELPKLESESAEWKRLDKALADGQGVLTYDIQSVPIAADTIYFIRAQWTIRNKPAFLLAIWVTPNFEVRGVDSFTAHAQRMPEFAGTQWSLNALPKLLNVFDFEGAPAILVTAEGLESFSIDIWKMTPAGPKSTGVLWGYGC
jgi:hypothetical protein